jgi:hypothetical protein
VRTAGVALLLALCAAPPLPASAQASDDADLIPQSIQGAVPAPTPGQGSGTGALLPGGTGRLYGEDALTLASVRSALAVPLPPPAPSDWENRSSLDLDEQWTLLPRVTAVLSDRFNLTEDSQITVPSSQMLRNDLREAYLSWEAFTRTYLEAGRVNLRDGIALGFNPTDFFRPRTLLDQASLDPSVLRQDRLGTFMLRGQSIWNGGAASLAFAPRLYAPAPLTESTPYGMSPKFDRTNTADRVLGSVSFAFASLSPQALVFHDGSQTLLGGNLSRTVGQSVVAYAEWAGGRQPRLTAQALEFGLQTGALPAQAPVPVLVATGYGFQNDLAVGASWSNAAKITINLEYHYHQAGYSGQDERSWFAQGEAARSEPLVTDELWYVRGFANDQQQPWVRQHVFVRADWSDAFIAHLELSGFAFVNLYDGSTLTQLAASYYLSDAWTLGAYASASLGASRSEFGSSPQAAGFILQLQRYF